MAEIETPEIDRQLDQARADLATAQANYDLSKTTAARYESLLKTESVAKQDVEDRVGDLQAKKAMVDSATFNVRRLEETQGFQKVYAPFNGIITARNIDIGTLINSGANAPGKELFDIASTNKLRVYVNVPQQYSRDVGPGRPRRPDAGGVSRAALPGNDRAQFGLDRPGIADAADGSGRGESRRRIAAGRIFIGAFQIEIKGERPCWRR